MSDPPVATRSSRLPGSAWIAIAFVPWMLYWILSAESMQALGIILAFTASSLLTVFRLIKGRPLMTVELVTLVFFSISSAFTVGLDSPVFLGLGRLFAYLVLSGTAFVSIAERNPFTAQYVRSDWPKVYWNNPIFMSTNNTMTGLWGLVFLADAVTYQMGFLARSVALQTVLPNLLLGLGVAFSVAYPAWHVKRAIEKQMSQAAASAWPSPILAGGELAKNEYDVAVVGAGIGGLSTGALLAKRGLKVLVVEQHYLAGGYCTSFPRKGHSIFDSGVHDISGLGPKGPVRFMLRELGIEDKLEFKRVTSEYVLPGIRFQVPHDWKDFVNLLGAQFPAERDNISAFFGEMKGIYDDIYRDIDERNGIIGPPQTAEEAMKYPLTHRNLFRWLDKTYLEMLDEYFSDARLKQILMNLTAYLTDNPKALQSFSMAPIFGYYFEGGYYPKGGSQALADALVSVIRSNGGTVLLNTRVTRILVKEGVAHGIAVEGMLSRRGKADIYNAGIVVSNADVKQTFLRLVDPTNLPAEFLKRIKGIEPSASAFMAFLSLDYDPPLAPLTFYTPDTGRGIGIAIPSKLDPDLAARGGSAMTIITLIPNSEAKGWNRDAPDYKIRKERFMEELIDVASELLPDLRRHIVYKEAATPATFQRYTSSSDGAIYGSKLGQGISFKSPIWNLYLVGSGTFPGAGIEAVTISALIAANDIMPRNVEVEKKRRITKESLTAPYLTV